MQHNLQVTCRWAARLGPEPPSGDEQVRPHEYMPHLHTDTPDTSPGVGEEAERDWEEYSRMFQSVPASRTSKVRSSR